MNRAKSILNALIFLVFVGCVDANEKTNNAIKVETVINEKRQDEDKVIISLKDIAVKLEKDGLKSESDIFFKALRRDSICIIQNEYSSMVQFEKSIKLLENTEEINNCFVIMNVENKDTYVLIKIAKPYAYSSKDNIVKGGIGWEIKLSNSAIEITTLEF